MKIIRKNLKYKKKNYYKLKNCNFKMIKLNKKINNYKIALIQNKDQLKPL